jgi:methyl-accepting chemotaxis protein
MPIGVKLPISMTLLVIVTIVLMAVSSAWLTRGLVSEAANSQLTTSAELKAHRVEELLKGIDRDLRLTAGSGFTIAAVTALTDGYESLENAEEVLRRVYITENPHPLGEKDQLVSADTGSSYGFIHNIYHPNFDRLQDEMEYYDIFLFDMRGDLVYSVFKENDFATNMLTGEWADSGLGEVFRQAVELGPNDPSAFVDFAPYAPSAGAPASFIGRPIFNAKGDKVGVLAYQMPIGRLSEIAGSLSTVLEGADGFVLRDDGLMITDAPMSDVNDSLVTRIDNAAARGAAAGQASHFEGAAYGGQDVMGHYVPIDFHGARWIVAMQQDSAVIFAGMRSSILTIAGISLLILLGVLAVSILFSRSLSLPLQRLTQTVAKVADGKLNEEVPETTRGDEIGKLARATEVFRQNSLNMETMNAEQAQAQEKMKELAAESEKAAAREIELAKERQEADRAAADAREKMMHDLGVSFGAVVQDAIDGKFSARVVADFADQTLIELAENINLLMGAVDQGLTETGTTLARVANGDLNAQMSGSFKGAFAGLQGNVNEMVTSLRTLVGEISESGSTLSNSASELQDTSSVLSRQAEQNAASMEETSAALEELSASIKQVSGNMADVSNDTKKARETALDSEVIAAEAASSMERIADGSKEIANVTGTINDIAFQINLLALNAGVEAARAGEAGRGFSVVASEVRGLAQRASEAAKEIGTVIERSDQAVAEGVAKVAGAKSSLEDISARVVSISENVDTVNMAISEQSAGIADITSTLVQIDGNAQRQAASFEELTASSHLLAGEAKDLIKSTAQFQVDEAGRGGTMIAAE